MKRYEVIGPHRINGVERGGVVECDPDTAATQLLVDVGHIRPVDEQPAGDAAAAADAPIVDARTLDEPPEAPLVVDTRTMSEPPPAPGRRRGRRDVDGAGGSQ